MKCVRILFYLFESFFYNYDYDGKNISFFFLIRFWINGGWLNLIREEGKERFIYEFERKWFFEYLKFRFVFLK